MEVRHGLWGGLSALYSESGRQLGEQNARPFILNYHLPADTVACNYDGSRAGKTINISALRIAMKHFDQALAITGAVRDYHIKKSTRTSQTNAFGLWDLYILSRASLALIAYTHRHHSQQMAGMPVSDAHTSQYQFISGVFMICRDMMNTADHIITENRPISAQSLYTYADEKGIFLSPNGMACAGGIIKIIEFLEFCISGNPNAKNEEYAATPDSKETLDSEKIISDPEKWYQYAISAIELDCFIELESLRLQSLAKPVRAAHFMKVQTIYRSLSEYCSTLLNADQPREDTVAFSQAALERQNKILKILGRPGIKKISEKHIEERLRSADN